MASSILITGATGFIGRHLTRDLLSTGRQVRVLARNPDKARLLFGDKVQVSLGDLRLPGSLKEATRDIETIYHIAGVYRFGLRHRREIYQSNIQGTENLLEAAAEAGVRKIVHVSSASVFYRTKTASEPWPILTEADFPTEPLRYSPYKFSKWEAERRVLAWVKRGLPVSIANPSCLIGSDDETPTPTGQIIRDFLRGRFPCFSHTGLNFVNVQDVSQGLQLIAEKGGVGERYLLAHENLWLKEFLDRLAEETSLPAPRLCLPHRLILALSCFGELADLLNPRSTSARLCLETAIQSETAQFFKNDKARRELGWIPTPIHSGIQAAVAWFHQSAGVRMTGLSSRVRESHGH